MKSHTLVVVGGGAVSVSSSAGSAARATGRAGKLCAHHNNTQIRLSLSAVSCLPGLKRYRFLGFQILQRFECLIVLTALNVRIPKGCFGNSHFADETHLSARSKG